jgi:hypothetical protein
MDKRPFVFDELLSAQQSRNELMKWKLLIVAAIGSTGLGFLSKDGFTNLYLIIVIIPIVSVYVDLLCRNLSLRTMKINRFAGTHFHCDKADFDIEYHRFYQSLKKESGTSLESIALVGSTVVLTVFVTLIGLIIPNEGWIKVLFLVSGILSSIFSFLVNRRYNKEKKLILEANYP